MKKEKKVIQHRILDKNTVLGIILITLLAFFLIQIVLGAIFGGIFGIIAALVDVRFKDIGVGCAMVLASLAMLAIHKRWFYPEFDGNLKPGKDFGKWILIGFALLFVIIVPDCFIMLVTGGHFAAPTLTSVLTALMAGTTEEVIFRAVPASYAMRQYNEEKKIPFVAVFTAVLFSLVHATNIFAGAAVSSTIAQLFSALGTGLLLCAIYLRCGNIIPSMIIHFLYDVYALMNADSVTETGIMANGLSARDIFINVLLFVIEAGIACFLLRKAVRGDIIEIWKKKWNKQAKESQNDSASETEAIAN